MSNNSHNTIDVQQVLTTLRNQNITITADEAHRIKRNFEEISSYKPSIAFFGKTGVGKSSLINALFGEDICPVSDVESCTRNIKRLDLSVYGNKSITLIDVPGLAENEERDREYIADYQRLLGEVDVVFWLLKADEKAYSPDEFFYKNVIKDHLEYGKPFFFILNQIDKMEPFREWNMERNAPGPHQLENIDRKIEVVAKQFAVRRDQVFPVSANERYNIINLVERMIFALPSKKVYSVAKEIRPENRSEATNKRVSSSILDNIFTGVTKGAQIGKAFGKLIPKIGPGIGAAIGGIIGGLVSLFD